MYAGVQLDHFAMHGLLMHPIVWLEIQQLAKARYTYPLVVLQQCGHSSLYIQS